MKTLIAFIALGYAGCVAAPPSDEALSLHCDDGESCDTEDIGEAVLAVGCRAGCYHRGVCVSPTVELCGIHGNACTSCDDGNPCTLDYCTQGTCYNPHNTQFIACGDDGHCYKGQCCEGCIDPGTFSCVESCPGGAACSAQGTCPPP